VSRSKSGRGTVTAPIFLPVPEVKLPKRPDLAGCGTRGDGVAGLIVPNRVEGEGPVSQAALPCTSMVTCASS
jgi:hypothetical protein